MPNWAINSQMLIFVISSKRRINVLFLCRPKCTLFCVHLSIKPMSYGFDKAMGQKIQNILGILTMSSKRNNANIKTYRYVGADCTLRVIASCFNIGGVYSRALGTFVLNLVDIGSQGWQLETI